MVIPALVSFLSLLVVVLPRFNTECGRKAPLPSPLRNCAAEVMLLRVSLRAHLVITCDRCALAALAALAEPHVLDVVAIAVPHHVLARLVVVGVVVGIVMGIIGFCFHGMRWGRDCGKTLYD